MFQLVHSIPIELKVTNNKFAAQTERLVKFRDLLQAEPPTYMEFAGSVNHSTSLFQRFVENSEEVAFDTFTFKQLRNDLNEITSGINGLIQLKQAEAEKKRKQEQKEEKRREEERKREAE